MLAQIRSVETGKANPNRTGPKEQKTLSSLTPEASARYRTAADLHPFHWATLQARGGAAAAPAAGARLDGGDVLLPLLGRILRVSPAGRTIRFEDEAGREVGYQRALVAVAYLASSQDFPLRGSWVAFRDLPGGDAFFRGPHSLSTPKIERAFGASPAGLLQAASRLGGMPVVGADATVELPGLPRIPLRVLLWAETQEFPASANMLTDARAHLHVALDVLWALSNVAIADLLEAAP